MTAAEVSAGLPKDCLVLADYSRAFAPGADGVPVLGTGASPLAALPSYPVNYGLPGGSGRILFRGQPR